MVILSKYLSIKVYSFFHMASVRHTFCYLLALFHGGKAFFKVRKNIVDVLGANRKTDGVRLNALIGQFFCGELAVCGGCGMNDKALDVCNIGKKRENLQIIDKPMRFLYCRP